MFVKEEGREGASMRNKSQTHPMAWQQPAEASGLTDMHGKVGCWSCALLTKVAE